MSSDARRDLPSDAAAVGAVLDQLGALRLRVSADLGVVASAVELEEHAIAAEVLDGVRSDLAGFAAAVSAPPPPAEVPVLARRRVLRAALPAAPALAAAAALVAVLAGVLPARGPATAPPAPALDAAAASYAELFRLHERGAPDAALQAAAHGLHAEIARVMAAAVTDPAGAEAALLLLAAEAGRLDDPDERADLRSVLAESQRLLAGLEEALRSVAGVVPPVADVPQPLPQPAPTAPAADLPTPPRGDAPQLPGPTDAPSPAPSEPTPGPTATSSTPSPTPTGLLPRSPEDRSTTIATPRRPPLEG